LAVGSTVEVAFENITISSILHRETNNSGGNEKVKNIDTKHTNKRNTQNSNSKRQDYHMKQGNTNDRTT